jgi:transposase
VARRERGESSRQIARELVVDRKTVRRWLRIDGGDRGKLANGRARSIPINRRKIIGDHC